MHNNPLQAHSHVDTQNLAYILTDTDFNIVGVQASHKKGATLLGGEHLYGGQHISAIDLVRHFLRDVGWENLSREVGKKCLSVVRPYKNFSSIELQIIPLQSNSGITGYIFNIIQRSDRKPRLSSGIQSSEIPYGLRSLLDNSQDIIFLKDKDLRYIYVNKSFCKFYNLKPEDVLGKTDFEFLPVSLADNYFRMDLELLEGKSSTFSGETVFNNRIIDYKKFIIKTENDEEYIAVVAKDVTYWRQLIENLESKQRDFEYFFNNNLFGAFFMMMDKPVVWNDNVNKEEVLDYIFQHQRVTRVNQVFAEQYGAKPEEMIGYKPQDFFGDDVEQARRVWREFLDNKGRLKTFTKEKHKSGKTIIIEGDYVGIYDEQGRFLGHFGVQVDVTEKLEHQEKMEEYRNLLEESFRVANMGGWESDLETGTIRWTKNLYKILQLKESFIPTEESVYKLISDETQKTKMREMLLNAIKSGKRLETEILVTTGSGKQKWMAITTVPVMENGHCKKLFGIIQDIHEKKLKELEYQKSEIRFRTIVDSAPGVIFVINTKGELTYISQNVNNYYEFKAEDLVGKQLLNFVHKDFQDGIRELFGKLKTHRCIVETPPHKVKAKGGGYRWTKTSMAPLIGANGELEAVLGMAMDITEIKKIEEALEIANAEAKKLASYYRSLVENQSVYVIKLDEKGRIIFANELFINDFVPPNLSGPPSIKKFIGYTEGAHLMEILTKMFEGNPSPETVTLEVFSENKKIKKFIQWEFRLTTDDRSEKPIIMGFGYDVTELMKAYEKTKELLHLTEEQNLRLQNFAYIISHNIRSHYANMQGLMNLYQMSMDPKEKENYLDLIAKAINNLGITIEDLNKILNIKKEFPQPSVPVNLKDEINIIKDTLIHEIVEAGARVELYVPHNIKVTVVPAYLNSILLNLFTNALKYRSPERPLVIEIHATKSGNRTIIKFKDNGLGIDLKRAKNKIFGLYKTFHNHPQARGFGLFITKTQVEAMGGSISVESEPNVGTTFILDLPS